MNYGYKEKILKLHTDGLSQTEIARELRCAKSTVHYHLNDKTKYNKRTAVRRNESKKWFVELTKNTSCLVCGEKESVCLDYHHLFEEDKYKDVSRLVNEMFSKEVILKEMEKCVCVCANCHRKIHANIILIENYI